MYGKLKRMLQPINSHYKYAVKNKRLCSTGILKVFSTRKILFLYHRIYIMKKLLFALLLSPLFSKAQQLLPRFENDTLFTSSGYKIYKGQILYLSNGSSEAGYFRFIRFHSNMARNDTYILQNGTILVNRLRNYKNSGTDNQSIRISGLATLTDGRKTELDFFLDFEKAIESPDRFPNELKVPEEFRNKRVEPLIKEVKTQATPEETKKPNVPDDLKKILIADEIKKLFDLYKAGALTKEEYEAQKKKLLERQ